MFLSTLHYFKIPPILRELILFFINSLIYSHFLFFFYSSDDTLFRLQKKGGAEDFALKLSFFLLRRGDVTEHAATTLLIFRRL